MGNKENLKKSVISAMTIFPTLIAFGIFLNIVTSQKVSWLFWLNIPAWIFEELFEMRFLNLSNSYIANFIFAVIFWLGVSMLSNLINKKFLRKQNGDVQKDS